MSFPYYLARLKQELRQRCERNPGYSIRAFSRALHISDGALSQILAGKRVPSLRTANRLIAGLDLAPEDGQRFIASLGEKHRARGLQRLSPVFRNTRPQPRPPRLTIDPFRVLSSWYHAAILELTFVDGFQPEARWIGERLGISAFEAGLALDRLLTLGLLEGGSGTIVKCDEQFTTADKALSAAALRKLQKQFLEKAIESLENAPVTRRASTDVTMAIDPKKLPLARQMIQEFGESLRKVLESGDRKSVYHLNVTLCPLER